MNYVLNKPAQKREAGLGAMKSLLPLVKREKVDLAIATVAVLINSGSTLLAPVIISRTVDRYIQGGDMHGVLLSAGLLLLVYLTGLVASYIQTIRMGTVGRRVLFNLRNDIFTKLQSLPVAFFNQNKAGDLISRINNDTDKLNQFFAQALVQFVGSFFLMLGAAIFVLSLNLKLGVASLLPALGVVIITRLVSPWVRKKNLESLQSTGGMSAEIQESINNFKVIVAFNRLDYFRKKFSVANEANYTASVKAGIANNIFQPIYTLAQSLAQLIVVAYGIALVSGGSLTIGLLVGFFLYVNNFYMPLRQIASMWATLQQSMAALDRISEVMQLESNLPVLSPAEEPTEGKASVLSFKNVSFSYPDGKAVLKHISFDLERGKTYALVGPTGGGKTTTASLMARLYDPTEGTVVLEGKDIRTYAPEERAKRIGFILQEPFLFTGSVLDNIFYGNEEYAGLTTQEKIGVITKANLDKLLTPFEKGLETKIQTGGETVSLGQRQLIAFMRAVLRKPDILILDEATANIDTVTEQLLEEILRRLPKDTTKVVIAHRLNTIEDADEIFFVNNGEVTAAGSMEQAVEMLMHGKRSS